MTLAIDPAEQWWKTAAKALVAGVVVGAAIGTACGLIVFAPSAHADPTTDAMHDAALVCRLLDDGWTFDGISADALAQGVDVNYVAESMIRGIVIMCPDYTDAFKAWVDAHRAPLQRAY